MLESVAALFCDSIDYAGLFPPASLSMAEAVRNYARYTGSPQSWALARFVVPIQRLPEFEAELPAIDPGRAVWRISGLIGNDPASDFRHISNFNNAHGGRAIIDSAEARVTSAGEVRAVAARAPAGLCLHFELPADRDPAALLDAVAAQGCRAKVRTGGVKPNAIPSAADVARFMSGCAARRLPFKATAGLHHAMRGRRALTYAADSPVDVMHGFVNVFAAAALICTQAARSRLEAVLDETDPSAFIFEDGGLAWRGVAVTNEDARRARSERLVSFGSCSFEEPIDDLRALGWL